MASLTRTADALVRHSPTLLGLTVAATLALVWPLVYRTPSSVSSPEPPGDIFEARDLAARRFEQGDHRMVFVVEARQGNLLRQEALLELYENAQALRRAPGVGDRLVPLDRPGLSLIGLATLADLVDRQLRQGGQGGLSQAPAAAVEATVAELLASEGPAAFGLSVETQRPGQGRGEWQSPAQLVKVLADNQALGGGGPQADLGTTDTTKEEFGRQVLALLRGPQRHLQVWGVALDANLTSLEQGRLAGPYIAATVFAVLMIFMAFVRSYTALAVTAGALAALMIWIKGLSNLVGLENNQILTTIVPIAMVSFGVDFAFHALGRYREQRALAQLPRPALKAALAGVLGALLVAMVSDSTAFLSNTTTAIESLVQFGVAATLATAASFWLLGIATPLAVMQLDLAGPWPGGVRAWAGALVAAAACTASVVLTAFVSAPWGAASWAFYAVFFVVLPWLWARRRGWGSLPGQPRVPEANRGESRGGRLLSGAVLAVVRSRRVVVPVILVLTVGCAYLAHQVRADFDVRDYFAATTDFVVGLDKFDEHVGEQGGEPAFLYLEGELADPRLVRRLGRFVDQLRHLETDRLARGPDGLVQVEAGLLTLVGGQGELSGQQLYGLYQRSLAARGAGSAGPPPARRYLWLEPTADQVPGRGATRITIRLPGSRRQENIEAVRNELEPLVARLRADLQALDGSARVVLTGRPLARQASLEAVLWAFRLSIPVALVLCWLVASLFMGSLRQGVVTVIPVSLVVAWLYALMYLWGYSVNVVTATIGALSIGIGIDFSVHLAMRFREELRHQPSCHEALRRAVAGTGGALAASAGSSVVGFAVLAWAPMPMFAAYGLLTACMIFLALVATLLVLPCLLLWGRGQAGQGGLTRPAEAAE